MSEHVDLAVVGGGISGLAAAFQARQRGARVVVLEAAGRPGGKVRTSPLAGVDLDEAADAFLARVPEAVDLCSELGLAADLVSPATGTAYVWWDGALRRLPAEQLLGVPVDVDAVAASGLLSPAGVERARRDLTLGDDRPGGDESVGALVRRRLGDEVHERLVAPLVGSIYAGDCDRLSLEVSAAQLAAARDLDPDDPSLVRAAATLRAAAVDTGKPVFLAPSGGVGRVIEAVADALGDDLRTGREVTAVSPSGAGFAVEPAGVVADAVVLAAPAFASGSAGGTAGPGGGRLPGRDRHGVGGAGGAGRAPGRDRLRHGRLRVPGARGRGADHHRLLVGDQQVGPPGGWTRRWRWCGRRWAGTATTGP